MQRRLERIGVGLLTLIGVLGFAVFPTYPNYDSIYALLWGREVLHFHTPSFTAYLAPTEHPLAVALGAVLSILGHVGDRVWIAICIASMVLLLIGVYKLGRDLFTPIVGLFAALLLASRLDFAFLAVRGYTDTAFLAFVVWAAIYEIRKPKRGTLPLVLLAFAGLLRPEAWLLLGVYWLWACTGPVSWRKRAAWALLVFGPMLLWMGLDYAVTGDALSSLTGTVNKAAVLKRASGPGQVPVSLVRFLINLDKTPVLAGGVIGAVLSLLLFPKRFMLPALLLASGLFTFTVIGVGGFSMIDRYLLVAAVMVMVFCAVALGGWSLLPRGWMRSTWMVGSLVLIVVGIAFTVTHVSLTNVLNELKFRGAARPDLQAALTDPRTKAVLKCGPIYTPNNKIVPDTRWLLGLPEDQVKNRADPAVMPVNKITGVPAQPTAGVAIITHQRKAIFNQILFDQNQDPRLNLPPAGFHRVLSTQYYTVYASCH